ncbi:UxaA family hydrolase [Paenibacillus sp. GCM10012307]|uniref:UxaA family hydrolase n=1 Tax=Paenibacillus roseus TaxID=2798579 RepID=A0A934J945_9BACL|nr:UxaA family hydrolase [Paenibacillus roseus]MBJ6363843.1 UxaA family hydrolase [Paenibacillus roseus]
MAGDIQAGADALVVDSKDHVATALRDLNQGETAAIRRGEDLIEVKLLDAVAFGHKIAVADIPSGTEVRKYGEVIGRSTVAIEAGRHVHVHNIEGIRGRGDQAVKEAQA